MKVLFLDFDGPLHPTDAVADLVYRGQDFGELIRQRNLFRWVKTLSNCTGCAQDLQIVVHSSWRRFLNNDQIRMALGPLADQFAGITPAELGRYEGIMEVVQRMGLADDEYLVVDDARDAYPTDFRQLVLVNPLRGVQEPAVRRRITAWACASAELSGPSELSSRAGVEQSKPVVDQSKASGASVKLEDATLRATARTHVVHAYASTSAASSDASRPRAEEPQRHARPACR